jgi:hypothetical protein
VLKYQAMHLVVKWTLFFQQEIITSSWMTWITAVTARRPSALSMFLQREIKGDPRLLVGSAV